MHKHFKMPKVSKKSTVAQGAKITDFLTTSTVDAESCISSCSSTKKKPKQTGRVDPKLISSFSPLQDKLEDVFGYASFKSELQKKGTEEVFKGNQLVHKHDNSLKSTVTNVKKSRPYSIKMLS